MQVRKVAVLGLGRFGEAVARELSRQGVEVLGVDGNLNRVNAIVPYVDQAESFDATNPELLASREIKHMDAVVVAIGNNFEASVLVTMHCHELGVPLVCAKALNDDQAEVLRKVGADQIIKPEEDMGKHLALHLTQQSVVDFVELPDHYSLRVVKVPDDWAGRSIAELDVLGKHRLSIIQVLRSATPEEGGEVPLEKIPLPAGNLVFQAKDQMEVIGHDKDLDKFHQ
ncbi:hypothetical protein CSB20_00255 [bacterium DOLZORAL124_64_63]|nr:MAG: hypothetical protein CSB20_00255 [bacterium DOLZORAL124_64_63]